MEKSELNAKYTLIREIGRGRFSVVFAALEQRPARGKGGKETVSEVAVKHPIRPIINKDILNTYRKFMGRYKELMKSPDTNCHVEVLDNLISEMQFSDGCAHMTPFVVMKKYDKTLKDKILEQARRGVRFEDYQLVNFIYYFIKHMRHLYREGEACGQMTVHNIFYEEEEDKYVFPDFAIPKQFKDEILSLQSEEVYFDDYAAPELALSHKSDIFSFGCILYEMITMNKYKIDFMNGKVVGDLRGFNQIIKMCTEKSPEKRPDHILLENEVKLMISLEINALSGKQIDENRYNTFSYFCQEMLDMAFPRKPILT